MATKTVYTSTITLPVYASWKCEKCNEISTTTGVIRCSRQASTSSIRSSKNEAASNRASTLAQEAWAADALKIMLNPRENAQSVRADFFVQNSKCCNCGAKARWDKDMKYMALISLGFFPAILSGVFAFALRTNFIAWFIFAVFLGMTIAGILSETSYKRMMKSLPLKFAPVIGSLNDELLEYADTLGKKIPTPEETIEIAKAGGILSQKRSPVAVVEAPVTEVIPQLTKSSEQIGFCRKCGAPLMSDSHFCHKCGTEVII